MSIADDVKRQAERDLLLDGQDGSRPEEYIHEVVGSGNYLLVSEVDYGDSRWESHTGYVFRLNDNSFIEFGFASGLTEMQDHYGIESVDVVEPYEATVTKYRSVKNV